MLLTSKIWVVAMGWNWAGALGLDELGRLGAHVDDRELALLEGLASPAA